MGATKGNRAKGNPRQQFYIFGVKAVGQACDQRSSKTANDQVAFRRPPLRSQIMVERLGCPISVEQQWPHRLASPRSHVAVHVVAMWLVSAARLSSCGSLEPQSWPRAAPHPGQCHFTSATGASMRPLLFDRHGRITHWSILNHLEDCWADDVRRY